MRQLHIAMVTNLGHGHVFPALALCKELVRRGHRVTYPSNSNYARRIYNAGVEPILFTQAKFEFPEHFLDLSAPYDSRYWIMATTIHWPFMLADTAITVPQLMEHYEGDPPDLVIYDRFALAGRILATQLDCPAVQTYPNFAHHGKNTWWQNGLGVNPEPMVNFGKALDLFLSAYGIRGEGNLWHTEGLNIHFIPKEFQYAADSFDERTCFVGPCLDRPTEPAWRSKVNGKEIILVYDFSSGADIDYFKTFIDALSDLECHVVLSLGERIEATALKAVPSNFEINQYASHLEILPYASLSVGRPGMGGTMEALYHGVPVITQPLTPLHQEIAFRLTELEVGISLPVQLSKDLIREVVMKALRDTQLRQHAVSMGQLVRSSGGAIMAADSIEHYLSADRR